MVKKSPLTLKVKFLLVGVGTAFGLLAVGLALLILSLRESATHFETVNDLRAAMLQRDNRDQREDRSVSLRSIIQPHESDEIIYQLRPGLDVVFQGVNVKTNSLGMRNPEVLVEKAPRTFRIALLGDSFAFGWGVEEQRTFNRVMEREIKRHLPTYERVESLNFGVPGYSTFQEVAKFVEQDSKFNVDAVVVYFVDNDFGLPFFIGNGGDNPLESSLQFVRRAWKGDNPEAVAEQKRLERLSDPNRALRKLANFLLPNGTPLFVVINPGKDAKKLGSKLWVLKERKDIIKIGLLRDVNEEIAQRGLSPQDLRLPNDPHPSAIKHEIIGRKMAEKIGKHLELRGKIHSQLK